MKIPVSGERNRKITVGVLNHLKIARAITLAITTKMVTTYIPMIVFYSCIFLRWIFYILENSFLCTGSILAT